MDPGKGFAAAAIAVFAFGIYAIPTKLYPTGDGISFQFFECAAIWICGFVAAVAVQGFDGSTLVFYPIAMLGGASWCIGNLFVVPVVHSIGISMGMLLWGGTNLLTGWLSGHFGFFGLKAETVQYEWLNYTGVAVAILSLILYFPIKPTLRDLEGNGSVERPSRKSVNAANSIISTTSHSVVEVEETGYDNDEETALLNSLSSSHLPPPTSVTEVNSSSRRTVATTMWKKIGGIVMALLSGVFYGLNTIPVQLLAQEHPEVNPFSFALSHFTGIFLTSTLIFLGYAAIRCNRPFVEPRSLLPGFIAGVLWAVAQLSWFVANKNLLLDVSFPIICIGPALVASLIAVLYFKEISGKRNLLWLSGAFTVTIIAIACITFSKKIDS